MREDGIIGGKGYPLRVYIHWCNVSGSREEASTKKFKKRGKAKIGQDKHAACINEECDE